MPEVQALQDPKDARSVTVDIAKWTMRERLEFNKVATTDDNAAIDFLIEKGVITAWSFAGSPKDKDAWLDLALEDFSFIGLKVMEAAQERFRKGR